MPEPKSPARLALCALLLFLLAPRAMAATLPQGFTEALVAGGLTNPTAMAFAPDGRIFVAEQGGSLRVVEGGKLLSTPFVTLTVSSIGERGLLGVAFDPGFGVNNQYVYVYYTATTPTIHNRVSRFVANGNVAVPDSEVILHELGTVGATNHNGGAIHFGPDGKLYVAVGDNAHSENAQLLTNRFGKILRINADGSIPDDNPFVEEAAGPNQAIWALGLRNPFTFAFQAFTGTMFINDVGQNSWEEINLGIAGANYGWPTTEGPTSNPDFVSPVHAYGHSQGCAISGGAFHSLLHPQFPYRYWGAYFFADFCGGWIRARLANGSVVDFASSISFPVDLKFGPDGALYYLARGTGSIWRVSSVEQPAAVDFTANGSDGPITVSAGMPLQIDLALNAGPSGQLPAAEMYIGVFTPVGVFWLSRTQGFVTTPVRYYGGPLPGFPPSPLLQIANVAGLAEGDYLWWVLVDEEVDGVATGTLSDFVFTRIE